MSSSTRSQILSMGTAALLSRAFAFVVPIALVRLLDMQAFGQYRLLWLIGGTVMLVATLGIPNSLLYFLPRVEVAEKRRFIYQTILLLAVTSLLAAVVVGPWNPWLPEKVRQLPVDVYTVPIFVFFWVLGSIIDTLPNADQRIGWQVRAIVGIGAFRAVVLIGAAAWAHDVDTVILAMIAIAVFRVAMLVVYTLRFHGLAAAEITIQRIKQQVSYAVPTGIAASMYRVRQLSEQWVVAILFSPAVFGVFAVAATVTPLVALVRQPVQAVILPKMSRAQAKQDRASVVQLNRRGNVAVSLVLLPAVGFLLVAAEPLMTVLFGQNYRGAGTIFQVYLLGVIPPAVEVGTILFAYAQTRFVMVTGVAQTVVAIGVSVIGAMVFGPAGAPLGSVTSGFIGMALRLRRAVQVTDIPLNELQDWSRLGSIALAVVGAMLIAALGHAAMSESGGAWLRMIVAGVLFVFSYVGLLLLFGFQWVFLAVLGRRPWIAE